MKKLFASLLAVSLVSTIALPAGGNFVPIGVDPKVEDRIAFVIEDHRDTPRFVSIVSRDTNMDQVPVIGNRWCRSFTTDDCRLEDGYILRASAILPVCVADEYNCVEGLILQSSSSGEVKARQVEGLEAGFTFESIPALGTPVGAGPSLWTADGVPHRGGSSQYVVAANLTFVVSNGNLVQYEALSAAVYPVKEISGQRYKAPVIGTIVTNGVTMWYHDNGEQGSLDGCTLTVSGKCWARTDFNPGVRAEVKLRVTNKISGWLHGRLQDPNIAIEPLSPASNRITVGAEPVEIPLMYAESGYSSLDAEAKEMLQYQSGYGGFAFGKQWLIYPSFNPYSRKLIARFASSVNDKAAAVYSSWQFNTVLGQQANQRCFDSDGGLVGLVTTNAMAYDQFAPTFKDGFLEYSVAGLHYLPDGKKALGVYDLVVRSDVARCLYGFSDAPVSAKVSVLTSDGDAVVASTQVSESNGWLRLAAYGFTFSEKKISVKVVQPQLLRLKQFKQGVKKLNPSQQSQLRGFASLSDGSSKVLCSATYLGGKNRSIAIAQAKAACDFVAMRSGDFVTEVRAVLVNRSSDALRVTLKSY